MRILILAILITGCQEDQFCVNGRMYLGSSDNELTEMDLSKTHKCVKRGAANVQVR